MQMRVTVSGIPELQKALARMDPGQNKRILVNGLVAAAHEIQANAAKKQIKRGGKGPPLPHRLTSRAGTLRRSIRVNRGPLPFAIEIGTDLGYGALHEFGGNVDVPSVIVGSHQRKILFGKKVKPFTVPTHFRMGHTAKYPKRPFLRPARDAVAPRFEKIVIAEWKKEARL